MAENHGKQTVWKDVISLAADYLERQNVPDPQIAAELLAARLLKCGRGFLVSSMDKVVPEPHLEAMRRGMVRLANGEPVQHVLGEWDFRKLTLKCDRRALIPRPETEDLVERVLKHLRTVYGDNGTEAPFVVDVGTGSGILALASVLLGAESAVGVDIDAQSVKTAKENAEINKIANKTVFFVGDLADKVNGKYDVICANIVADVIIRLLPDVHTFLKANATLIISGIIDIRKDDVLKAVKENGFKITEECYKDNWCAFSLERDI